ncbi:DUF4307 domain-containing protein [Nocardia cyriacigeorgica]|uniref:DUF4307 domain-containing protein n=1 Tax=Nocardia cyriacigeorgica TaxID=135487 RepID=UPI001892F2C0|nr:DUF4307 domain-containing protein [Nocardia cyriacigeorgica]MBF6086454.1 DUF4307 domain-containing protein [Nocardia cyriacigeorgica]
MTEPDPSRAADVTARNADRYGARPSGQRTRRKLIALGLGLVVLVAGVVVAYLGWSKYGPDDIQAEQLGYTVIDDSTIEVRIKVTRDDATEPVVCFVRAMSRDNAEVGRREVLIIGADPNATADYGTIELTTRVRSSERPSSASVYGCTDKVPQYLRAG